MINFTPHTPPLEPPLGNQFTLGLEKKKRILVVLNLLYQNLQKSGYLKFQQTVPLIKLVKYIISVITPTHILAEEPPYH